MSSLNTLGKFLSCEVFFLRQTIVNGIIICTVGSDTERGQECQQFFQRFPAAIPKHMCPELFIAISTNCSFMPGLQA